MRTTTPWTVLTCNNPSPMTLEGTNTYLVGLPGEPGVVIVDPGPQGHHEHLEAVLAETAERTVEQILITHRHGDHYGAAAEIAERTGAPVRGFSASLCRPGSAGDCRGGPLSDGEVILVGSLQLQVLHTPGHTQDSLCFWLPQQQVMLTGDTILGRGTTMVDFPDGTLEDYFESLDTLRAYGDVPLLPGHGPIQPSLGAAAQRYADQRRARLEQLRQLQQEHLRRHRREASPEELAEQIYGQRTPVEQRVIHQLVSAQLDYLRKR